MNEQDVRCPECRSDRVYKDGLRRLRDYSRVQRWLCRDCGFRFSEPKILDGAAEWSKRARKLLNINCATRSIGQVCDLTEESKNLTAATETKTVAGEVAGTLINFCLYMKREGLAEGTIRTNSYLLRRLKNSGANLDDPESVKMVLSTLNLSQNTKATMKAAYTSFLKFNGKTWKPPKIRYQQKIPFIPLESEIDALIAGCGKQTSTLLLLLKETGMRIGEALRLAWLDLNPQNNTITLNAPEKNGNPRMCKISPWLVSMIQNLPKKGERIFGKATVRHKEGALNIQRKKLALKLGNPQLNRITFHTLRHWKGTMEYHKTRDPYHVKKILGHKSMKSTEVYINIEQAVFNETNEEYHVKVGQNLDEACKLMEVGFEYVTEMEGKKLFRKRK